jgi:hypothetical protein
MQIHDYETGRTIDDVALILSPEEASELHAYLGRLLARPELRQVTVSEVRGVSVAREFSVVLEPRSA